MLVHFDDDDGHVSPICLLYALMISMGMVYANAIISLMLCLLLKAHA
jgi:hypothetical protein